MRAEAADRARGRPGTGGAQDQEGSAEEVICTISTRVLLAFGDKFGMNDAPLIFWTCREEIERAASQKYDRTARHHTKSWMSANAICEPWSRPFRGGLGGRPGPGSLRDEQMHREHFACQGADI
jgi:hypothetical protein